MVPPTITPFGDPPPRACSRAMTSASPIVTGVSNICFSMALVSLSTSTDDDDTSGIGPSSAVTTRVSGSSTSVSDVTVSGATVSGAGVSGASVSGASVYLKTF